MNRSRRGILAASVLDVSQMCGLEARAASLFFSKTVQLTFPAGFTFTCIDTHDILEVVQSKECVNQYGTYTDTKSAAQSSTIRTMVSRAKPESQWRLRGSIPACPPHADETGKIAKGQTQEADHPGWWCFFLFYLGTERIGSRDWKSEQKKLPNECRVTIKKEKLCSSSMNAKQDRSNSRIERGGELPR